MLASHQFLAGAWQLLLTFFSYMRYSVSTASSDSLPDVNISADEQHVMRYGYHVILQAK